MTEAALRTAQAARFLNVSADTLRKLSRLGLVETEESPGGHFRYPLPVLERLKREGLPPIPCEIPAADDDAEPESQPEDPPRDRVRHNGRVTEQPEQPDDDEAGPGPHSDAVALAEGESLIEEFRARTDETSLKRLRIQYNRDDEVRAREQRDRQAQDTEQARQRAAADVQECGAFMKRWQEYAVSKLPYGLDGHEQVAILEGVNGTLQKLGHHVTEWAARRAVDIQIDSGLAPWNARKKTEALIETACGKLPYGMRNDVAWSFRAIEAATNALKTLRREASQYEKEQAVGHAINLVKATFEYLELCALKTKTSSLPYEATSDETEAARNSVRQALEALPLGSSDRELDAARAAALAPYLATIRTRKDRKMREGLIPNWVYSAFYLPSGMDGEALKKEIQQAIDACPEFTPERDLEAIRDKIRDRRRREHTEKEVRINHGLNYIQRYVRHLNEKYDGIDVPSDFTPLWRIMREHLETQINHETPLDEVEKAVRFKLRRYFHV